MNIDYHSLLASLEIHVKKAMSFRRDNQIEFLHDIKALSENGVAPFDMYSFFASTYDGCTREISKSALKALNQGRLVTLTFDQWFPREVVTSLRIGEEKGMMNTIIPNVIAYLDAGKAGIGLFIAKLLYPFLIFMVAVFMASLMSQEAYPIFIDMSPIEQWDPMARNIYQSWEFILNNGLIITGAIIGLYIFVNQVINRYTGSMRSRLDRMPFFSQYRSMQASSFLQVFGLLIADMSPLSALEEIRRGSNPYLRGHIQKMISQLAAGKAKNAEYLDSGLLTSKQIARLTVLSKTNEFNSAVLVMGSQNLDKTVKQLTHAASFMGMIGLAVAGLSIASVVLGVMITAQAVQ